MELDEQELALLDETLRRVSQSPGNPSITVTHFVSDAHKQGGQYVKTTAQIQKVDIYNRRVLLTDGSAIALEDIGEIQEADD